jgi:hypothetical protein
MYKELTVESPGEQQKHIVRDNGDGSFTSFPADKSNQNYQAYLAWLEAGNTPLAADTQPE